MSNSTIGWTNYTWNPVTGCQKISPGCKNCYAETMFNRLASMSNKASLPYQGRKFTDVMCHPARLDQPLHLKKPKMIFVNSMSDLFHEDVPFEFIHKVFYRMKSTPQHTYQILTKRPERMLAFIMDFIPLLKFEPLKNVWLGVSVENQKTADKRIPLLLQTPAAVRWISAEPLLEGINIFGYLFPLEVQMEGYKHYKRAGLDWVIVGGESGPKARVIKPEWVRSLRDQCKITTIPFFFKQWGEWCREDQLPEKLFEQLSVKDIYFKFKSQDFDGDNHFWYYKVGSTRAENYLDGKQYLEYPNGKP